MWYFKQQYERTVLHKASLNQNAEFWITKPLILVETDFEAFMNDTNYSNCKYHQQKVYSKLGALGETHGKARMLIIEQDFGRPCSSSN